MNKAFNLKQTDKEDSNFSLYSRLSLPVPRETKIAERESHLYQRPMLSFPYGPCIYTLRLEKELN